MSSPSPIPAGLDEGRHQRLAGRGADLWVRRLVLLAFGVIVVAALLDVFGQQPTTSVARSPAAGLTVNAPTRLRGGLIFQARFTVTAVRRIDHPTLSLERGWFDSISVNSIVPDPTTQSSDDDHVNLSYDTLDAGQTMTVYIYFQANPTNFGRQRQRVALTDGGRVLATIDRSVLIFP